MDYAVPAEISAHYRSATMTEPGHGEHSVPIDGRREILSASAAGFDDRLEVGGVILGHKQCSGIHI